MLFMKPRNLYFPRKCIILNSGEMKIFQLGFIKKKEILKRNDHQSQNPTKMYLLEVKTLQHKAGLGKPQQPDRKSVV